VIAARLERVVRGELPDPADHLAGPAVQDVQDLGGDPGLDRRVARRVEAPARFPQVFQGRG